MRSLVQHVDARVDNTFDRLRGQPLADRVFYTASALGDFGMIWVMLALIRALRGRPNDDRAALRAIIATGTESVLVNAGIKSLFGRGRPTSEIVHPHPFRQPLTSSFPSGHATAAFCAAVLLSDQDDLGLVYFGGATVVAASRIHTKIHHASDVLGGIAVGTALGLIGRRLAPLPTKRAR
ncbi:MAG: phosphatase PAP2 family protein [Acidimicrobiales bacterium]